MYFRLPAPSLLTLVTICLVLQAQSARSQSNTAEILPVSADDPEVVVSFMKMLNSIQADVKKRNISGDNAGADALQKSWNAKFGISDADSARLRIIASDLESSLDGLKLQSKTYFDYVRSAGQSRDPLVLEEFRNKRAAMIGNSIVRLSTDLSPAGALSIKSFLVNEFAASVTKARIGQ